MNTRNTMIVTLFGLAVSLPVMASTSSYDEARVLDVEPITRTVRISTPREECWDEVVTRREPRRSNNGVSTIVGAILGGALGNAVGHSSTNKKVGAVVGAVLGGSLGRAHASNRYQRSREYTSVEERCEVIHDYEEREKVIGYSVSYEYGDQIYTSRMDEEPGETVRVRVTVAALQ